MADKTAQITLTSQEAAEIRTLAKTELSDLITQLTSGRLEGPLLRNVQHRIAVLEEVVIKVKTIR